jgi:pseudouridine synthase
MEERLQKLIARAGICSRRRAEELIERGAVKVNGKIAKLGDKADPKTDKITVNRVPLRFEKKLYLALYKPRGYVSTMKEQFGRPCIADLLEKFEIKERLFSVGRLDYDSEGLIIVTNDGELANRIMHPRFEVEKTYKAVLGKPMDEIALQKLKDGVFIDGRKVEPSLARILENPKTVEITIHEGRNRIVRKVMEKLGYKVIRLKRTRIGSLKLGKMREGELKEITKEEIEQCFKKGILKVP